MQKFIEKYGDRICGVLTGFDRLVFRGSIRRLSYCQWDPQAKLLVARAMEEYLWQNKVRFKDFAEHVKTVSAQIKTAFLEPFRKQGLSVIPLRSASVDKDALARAEAHEKGITTGLVCALSSVEIHPSFEHRGIHLARKERPSGVLYLYQIHPQVGWMYGRIQTWFPFHIQIGLNGREWLARQMDQEGLKYRQQGNCFVWIEDYVRAQQLLDEQVKTDWVPLLQGIAEQLNPLHDRIFENFYAANYYWSCYQSEWATDIMFSDTDFLKRLMSLEVRHAMGSYCSVDVLRYFGQRVNQSGAIPASFRGHVQTDFRRYPEGERVKFAWDGNTVKFYDKAYSDYGSVLRAAETTINRVQHFKEYRTKQKDPEGRLQWLPLRKATAGLYRRVQISQSSNERLIDALASVDDSRTVEELAKAIQQPTHWKGRRVRALHPWGDDKDLLKAINHGEFFLHGFRNRDLQALLYSTAAQTPAERRRRSAAISRKLRMLRAHGLIQKVPHTHRYQVQPSGRTIIVAVLTAARASVNQLNQIDKRAA